MQRRLGLSDVHAAGVSIGMSLGAAGEAVTSRGKSGERLRGTERQTEGLSVALFSANPTDELYLRLNMQKNLPLFSHTVF